MKLKVAAILFVAVLFVGLLYVITHAESVIVAQNTITRGITQVMRLPLSTSTQPASTATSSSSEDEDKKTFVEDFSTAYTIEEDGSRKKGKDPNWWVSSGAYLHSDGGFGSTVIGALPEQDYWRGRYAETNPRDTDDGYHPQNIFRLVLKSTWADEQQEVYFKIVGDNLSDSQYRNSSNGLLLFNRYQDEFNLYYTGIRVDGYVTIKKKIDGVYYTPAYKRFINGPKYDRDTSPNLLPKDTWIGVRSDVVTNADGTVTIKVYIDIGKTGNWALAAEAVDDGVSYGGPVFEKGYAGIRTDFMDVLFDDYSIKEL